jgi:hypothetical protein
MKFKIETKFNKLYSRSCLIFDYKHILHVVLSHLERTYQTYLSPFYSGFVEGNFSKNSLLSCYTLQYSEIVLTFRSNVETN